MNGILTEIVNDFDEKFSFSFVNDELKNEKLSEMMI
jgi:hypothetical protein